MDRAVIFDTIVGDLYQGALDSQAWHRGLRAIARLVGGKGPYLLAFDPSNGRIIRDEIRDYDPAVFSEFRRDWATKDIRVRAGLHVPIGRALTERMILPNGEWERSEVFNEFLSIYDAGWFLATWLHKSPTKVTCLSVQATTDRGPFNSEDVARVEPFLPHVRRALDIKDQLEVREIRATSLRHVLEATAFGVLLLNSSGVVVEASQYAVTTLEQANALARQQGGGYTLREPTGASVRQLITSALRSGPLRQGVLHVRRGAFHAPLSLVLAPIPSTNSLTPWISEETCWLLFIFDPDAQIRTSVEILMADLTFTRREAELAGLLAVGLELAAAAKRMGVAASTARSHLKSMFSKTATRSQSDLVRRILTGPARR